MLCSVSKRSKEDLRDDQRFLTDLMRRERYKLIVAPMGRGKTGATLTAMREHLDSGDVRRYLVVAPLRVAKDTWPDEIEAWKHTAVLNYAVCVGTEKERRAALAQNAEVTIVNRENLVWLWKELGSGQRWDFDGVVVDESSMFKAGKKRTGKSKRKRADGSTAITPGGKMTRFGVLAAARKKVNRLYELTGTPGELIDLWGQAYLLDLGERLGSSRSAFLQRWFDQNQYSRKITPKSHAEREIMELLGDVMVSLPELKLVPDPVFIPVKVQLSKATMEEYRRFARTLVSEQYDLEAVSRGVLTNKLLQFANGSAYHEEGHVVPIHTEKLDALDELIERAAGDPVLVFYGFRFDLDQIRKRHPDAVVLNESDTAVRDWNDGKIPILLAHPASCAHGLNLQYGGHIAIWYGLTWSLELYLQANARLPRPGQKHLVAIYQIIAENTVDERVLAVLERKGATQDAIIDAVRYELEN